MSLLITILLLLAPTLSVQEINQTIRSTDHVLVALSSSSDITTPADQQVTTVVQDPGHPKEPWVVTTYRKDSESVQALIKRHKEMVEAVRDAL